MRRSRESPPRQAPLSMNTKSDRILFSSCAIQKCLHKTTRIAQTSMYSVHTVHLHDSTCFGATATYITAVLSYLDSWSQRAHALAGENHRRCQTVSEQRGTSRKARHARQREGSEGGRSDLAGTCAIHDRKPHQSRFVSRRVKTVKKNKKKQKNKKRK